MKTSIVGFSSIFEDISVEIIQVEEQKKEWIKRNPLDTIKSININKLGISKGEGTQREGKKIIKGNNGPKQLKFDERHVYKSTKLNILQGG